MIIKNASIITKKVSVISKSPSPPLPFRDKQHLSGEWHSPPGSTHFCEILSHKCLRISSTHVSYLILMLIPCTAQVDLQDSRHSLLAVCLKCFYRSWRGFMWPSPCAHAHTPLTCVCVCVYAHVCRPRCVGSLCGVWWCTPRRCTKQLRW
jgi:hypothetical protein